MGAPAEGRGGRVTRWVRRGRRDAVVEGEAGEEVGEEMAGVEEEMGSEASCSVSSHI